MGSPVPPEGMGRTAIPEPQPQPEPVAASAPAPRAGPRTCLIVDDSRVVRKVSRQIVESLGYQVTEAENGEEALARCKQALPDLVLLDWDMPVMTGIEFITALRAVPGNERTKAMFCTSKGGAHDIHRGISAGADEFVVKPFDAPTMLAKLRAIGAA